MPLGKSGSLDCRSTVPKIRSAWLRRAPLRDEPGNTGAIRSPMPLNSGTMSTAMPSTSDFTITGPTGSHLKVTSMRGRILGRGSVPSAPASKASMVSAVPTVAVLPADSRASTPSAVSSTCSWMATSGSSRTRPRPRVLPAPSRTAPSRNEARRCPSASLTAARVAPAAGTSTVMSSAIRLPAGRICRSYLIRSAARPSTRSMPTPSRISSAPDGVTRASSTITKLAIPALASGSPRSGVKPQSWAAKLLPLTPVTGLPTVSSHASSAQAQVCQARKAPARLVPGR